MEKALKDLENHLLLKNKFIERKNSFFNTKTGKLAWLITKSFNKSIFIAGFLGITVVFFLAIFLGFGTFISNVIVTLYLLSISFCGFLGVLTHNHASIDYSLKREIASRLLEVSERYPSSKKMMKQYAKELDNDMPHGWWWKANKLLIKAYDINHMNYDDVRHILLNKKDEKDNILYVEIEKNTKKQEKYEEMDLI